MYNRAIIIHKYIYEALMSQAWAEIIHWIDDNQEILTYVWTPRTPLNQHNIEACYMSIFNIFEKHMEWFVTLSSPWQYGALCMSYLDIIETLERNWELYLNAIRVMTQWCVAYDTILARCTDDHLRMVACPFRSVQQSILAHPCGSSHRSNSQ